MEAILTAIIAASATILVALIGQWGLKKRNQLNGKEKDPFKLVTALSAVVTAQTARIELLESVITEKEEQIKELLERVKKLERITLSQASTINEQDSKLTGQTRTRRSRRSTIPEERDLKPYEDSTI